MKKLTKALAWIAAIVVFVLVVALAGSLEGLYQSLFPDLSPNDLRTIESISNIVGLALAIFLSIKTYKRLANATKTPTERGDG